MCGICGCGEEDTSSAPRVDGSGAVHGVPHHDHDHAHGHVHAHPHERDRSHDHDHSHGHEASSRTVSFGRDPRVLSVERSLFEKNDRLAAFNRGYFAGRGVFAVNLWSAPGSGKTSLIERMVDDVGASLGIGVIEGDLATERDAERIRARGARVVQVNTGAVCHLDAHMVGHALETLNPLPGSTVLIENVGNLVCPAMFDLGEAERIVLLSVTEGEDKPIKYPHMFAKSTAVVLSKIDLLPHVPFDMEQAMGLIREVSPHAPIFSVSARTGEGMGSLYVWLEERRPRSRSKDGSIAPAVASGSTP